jgi:hypothetical protein
MTEAEWLSSTDAWNLLEVVERLRPSERKVRLFNAAICRRFWDYLPEASRVILTEAELLADGLIQVNSDDLCWRANDAVPPFGRLSPIKQFLNAAARIQRAAATAVCYAVLPNELWGAVGYFWDINPAEKGAHAGIIRDIFANPFRPIAVNPSWLAWNGGTIPRLAQSVYDERAFDRLPVLADALEEAGCPSDILTHCRSPGPHVLGCWVLDLILGKC